MQIIRFLISGGVATLIHFGALRTVEWMGAGPHQSYFIGFVVAVIGRFLIDRTYVFRSDEPLRLTQFANYSAACVVTYFISASLFYLFHSIVLWPVPFAFLSSVVLSTGLAYVLIRMTFGNGRRRLA